MNRAHRARRERRAPTRASTLLDVDPAVGRVPLLPHGRRADDRRRTPRGASSRRRCASSSARRRLHPARRRHIRPRVRGIRRRDVPADLHRHGRSDEPRRAPDRRAPSPAQCSSRDRALERTGRPFETEDARHDLGQGQDAADPGRGRHRARRRDDARGAADARSSGGDDELERLREVLDGCRGRDRRRRSRSSGPPGIGKTRLLEHVLDETPLPVLRAYGDRYGANSPYRTLQSLLRPLLGIPPSASPAEAGARLRDAVEAPASRSRAVAPAARAGRAAPRPSRRAESDALDDAFRAERTAEVLADLLETATDGSRMPRHRRRAVGRPGIGRGADRGDRRATRATRSSSSRRDEAGRPRAATASELALDGPRRRAASATSSRRSRGAGCCRPTRARSSARAEGNPLYAIELATGLAIGRRHPRHRAAHRRAHRRAHRDRARRRSGAPSVLGVRHPARALREVRRDAAASSGGLGAFLELGAEGVSFRSELFRDVAYEQLTFQARRELHRAAAAALEADPALGGPRATQMLATHYEAAGDWDAARRAARRARPRRQSRAFALEEAVRSYRIAVEAARRSAGAGDDLADAARGARPRERRRRLGEGGARGVLERPQAHRRRRRPGAARPRARVRAQHPRPAGRGGARPARRRAARSRGSGRERAAACSPRSS